MSDDDAKFVICNNFEMDNSGNSKNARELGNKKIYILEV